MTFWLESLLPMNTEAPQGARLLPAVLLSLQPSISISSEIIPWANCLSAVGVYLVVCS